MPLFIECELGRRRKIEYSAEQRRTSWITHFRWNPHVSHEFNLCPLWWSVSSMQYSLGHLNNAAFHTRTNLIFCRFHPYNKHNTQTSKTNIFPLRTQIFSHRFTFTPNCLPREYHCCIYNILPSFKTTKTHHNLSIHRIISADKTIPLYLREENLTVGISVARLPRTWIASSWVCLDILRLFDAKTTD
jgi:hypothetical protein